MMKKDLSKFSDKIYYYQSANNDAKSIKENFVIRVTEFQQIIGSLLNKKSNDPLQHELILGRRGSGKSTLLKRIEIEICENDKLNKKYIAINFPEEQSSIYRLFDLWTIVIAELNDKFDENIITKSYSEFKSDEEYTRYLYSLIQESLQKKKKRLVLLLDNFDRVVESFQDDGNLLRETLINFHDVQIIGGSTRMNEHFWKYDQPFYEFFRRHHLEALSSKEMMKLILHWSETLQYEELKVFAKNNLGKIESIRILTDGLPRTLQFFIEILLDNSELYGYDYLKKIMDKVTPVYQERLNMLTPQLRKIVAEMAFLWEACSTKQLVEKSKMPSKLVSANLKTLIDKGLVTKIETGKKNHLYIISERFFNMWFIVTQGNPIQKRKAKWLSIFLEHWYGKNEFESLVIKHLQNLKSGEISHNKLLLLSKGISQTKFITTSQRDEILSLSESFQNKIGDNVIPLPRKYKEIEEDIVNLFKNKNYEKAISLTNEIENEEDGLKFFLLGHLYKSKKEIDKAEEYFHKVIEKGTYYAFYNLAKIYEDKDDFNKAEEYYKKAIENDIDKALFNLAQLYLKSGNIEKGEEYYIKAADKENIQAVLNLGILYLVQKKQKKSYKLLDKAFRKGNLNIKHVVPYIYYTNYYKIKAIEYLKKISLEIKNKEPIFLKIEILIEISNGIFQDIEKRIEKILEDFGLESLEELLQGLLIHKQNQLTLKLFNHPEFGEELKERYLVFYYATLTLIDNKNIELLSIPPEIEEVLSEVLEEIQEKQKGFGY